MGRYLAAGGGERGEDVGVDEVELRLDLVAAQVVDGRAALVQDQVLGGGPEPKAETACSRHPAGRPRRGDSSDTSACR